MEPIVSPWFVYALSVASGVKTVALFLASIFGCVTAFYLIGNIISKYEDSVEDWKKAWGKAGIGTVIIFITFLLLGITIPSKKVL